MKRSQRGAALLMAMLTVALVATFATAALWQQWRSVEVETAERARVQSGWILNGALDWSRLLLREDHMGNGINGPDHLGEPWAVPLQEARLSSFLAAERGSSDTSADMGPEVMDAFLSGQIIDLQSLMNVNNLVDPNGKLSDDDVDAFARLFDILGLPQSELEKLVENLRFSVAGALTSPGPAQAPLRPQRVPELVWLGLSPETVAVLEPYVTLLPQRTLVNVNTASAEVIAAAAGIDLGEAQQLVQVRQASAFKSLSEIQSHLGRGAAGAPQGQGNELTFQSKYFEVRARLRLDKLIVEERSVLYREGTNVSVLQRERGAVDPRALSQAAQSQR
jgi:general secretion pathway protein K